jgi:adenylosuccinate synthase
MMSVVVVVGAQWGDEGKGKVVDLLTEGADVVVRFGGGANAGHTLVIDGKQLVTHLIPSGVLHPGTKCVLGGGMVIDPETLMSEIAECKSRGLLADEDLLISESAHVILPYHRTVEALREDRSNAIGTTRRGIGPAYEAKAGRRGVRMRDLRKPDKLRALIAQNMEELAPIVLHYGGEPATQTEIDETIARALEIGESLAGVMGDAGAYLSSAMGEGKNVLFEGAQGALLDVDHGTYPYVTSSSTIAAGASQGTGIGPTKIDRVVGITKAYATRVGGGPFPTEMQGEEAETLRTAGSEFGATTGRPRRCGWLDLPALRLAIRINGMEALALTKLDVLGCWDTLKVCVAYRLDDETLEELPADPEDLARVEPVYREFEGWSTDISGAKSLDDLPAAARAYVAALEELIGIPFMLVSVGPDRTETIQLTDPFAG